MTLCVLLFPFQACGQDHTVFLLDDGSVMSCGHNEFGQLGHEKGTMRPGGWMDGCSPPYIIIMYYNICTAILYHELSRVFMFHHVICV